MTQHYIFNNQRDYYFDATASDVAGSPAKYTFTSRFAKSRNPETTTLRSPQGNEGTIHWKNSEIEIDGVKHHIRDIKQPDLEDGGEYVAFFLVHCIKSLTVDLQRSRFPRFWILGDKQWWSGFMPDSKSWQVT